MEEDKVSITALITAFTRGYHAANESPVIFDDYLASKLFSPEEEVFFRSRLAALLPAVDPQSAATAPDEETALHRVMQTYNGSITLSRSCFTEESLLQSVTNGIDQYVILGAGFDTFVFRHLELADRLQVFEVDHPATQTNKRERLQRLSTEIPSNLHLVSVNFEKDDLKAALFQAGYNPEKPTFFSWLGVTFYLDREAIQITLQTLTQLAALGSVMVFDYMDSDAFLPEKVSKRAQIMQMITRQTGEPIKTGFEPADLETELEQYGFHIVENLTPSEIETRYFSNRNDSYHAFEHVHFIKAVVS